MGVEIQIFPNFLHGDMNIPDEYQRRHVSRVLVAWLVGVSNICILNSFVKIVTLAL